jgi:predicted  nucleic acid-binding Zn-ribbon protein
MERGAGYDSRNRTAQGNEMGRKQRGKVAVAIAVAACTSSLFVARAAGQDNPDRVLTDALLQEGTILQEQAAKLQPTGIELDQERKRLQAEEIQLTDEAANVSRGFEVFNKKADQLNATTAQQRETCSAAASKFQSEVDACNKEAETLRAQAAELTTQGKELDRQQEDVNKRIVQHNAAGREWNKRNKEHQQQWVPRMQQAQAWIGRFQEFVDSKSFADFSAGAGSPADCKDERMGALNPLDTLPVLGRALRCLKALKAGNG